MKPIVLSRSQWNTILDLMHQEHTKSVFLIRSRMKDKLGFTPRDHSGFINGRWLDEIHLDFYNEKKRTMFLMKYSEHISRKEQYED